MLPLLLASPRPLRVLALGAHCDDIEIGAGGLLLALAEDRGAGGAEITAAVLSATPERAVEFRSAAQAFCEPVRPELQVHDVPDGRFPEHWGTVKAAVEAIAAAQPYDLVLCPSRHDAHQDHRVLAEIVTTCFRDHLVLRYEIPKWDGDLGAGRPAVYVPLPRRLMDRKWQLLRKHYPSQESRDWWSEETFLSLGRLRGLECRSPYAEAFELDKGLLAFAAAGGS